MNQIKINHYYLILHLFLVDHQTTKRRREYFRWKECKTPTKRSQTLIFNTDNHPHQTYKLAHSHKLTKGYQFSAANMAEGRFTRTGRKIPSYGRKSKSKATNFQPTSNMELDTHSSSPKQSTSKLAASLDIKDYFATDDEESFNGSQTSGSERSIDEQKTPKPAKKIKTNTPTIQEMDTSTEEIQDLPAPVYSPSILEQTKNSEKKDQHWYYQTITN